MRKPVFTSLLYHIEFNEESQSNIFCRFLWAEMQYRCFSPETNVKGLYSIYSLQIKNFGAVFYLNSLHFCKYRQDAACFSLSSCLFSLSVAGRRKHPACVCQRVDAGLATRLTRMGFFKAFVSSLFSLCTRSTVSICWLKDLRLPSRFEFYITLLHYYLLLKKSFFSFFS